MDLVERISEDLSPKGFECYPFKVGWYNAHVGDAFKFPMVDDTLAIIVISTPAMFEKALMPFIEKHECGVRDPVDECVAQQFDLIKNKMPTVEIQALHDFELDHSRRPRVLVQTAGHVAGAVTYYQRRDVINDPWPVNKKIFGACIHPKYGGWFALRGVLIFKNISMPDLPQKAPPDVLPTDEQKIDFLEKFNFHWRDWSFRDVIPVSDRYSDLQRIYFDTLPKNRKELLKQWIEEGAIQNSTGSVTRNSEGDIGR